MSSKITKPVATEYPVLNKIGNECVFGIKKTLTLLNKIVINKNAHEFSCDMRQLSTLLNGENSIAIEEIKKFEVIKSH